MKVFISTTKKKNFVKSFTMNTCGRFSKIMMKINKMASIAIMIGGVLINATASVGGSHLAKYFSGET